MRNLRTRLASAEPEVLILDDVGLSVERGQTLGIVGESGCGKSVTCLAILDLLPKAIERTTGQVLLNGQDLSTLSPAEARKIRGGSIAMIFQDPIAFQNPVMRVGDSLKEVLRRHRGLEGSAARREAEHLLERVGIARVRERLRAYPHELSGGMNQRVMIARALACRPQVMIADEPTTALDVTTQAQILDLLGELRDETGMALILITHDLGVIAEMADQVAVMYCGRVVEQAPVASLFARAAHPYTRGLLKSAPPLYPEPGHTLSPIAGTVPALTHLPAGCHFHPRCPVAIDRCSAHRPGFVSIANEDKHVAACLRTTDTAA